MKIQLLSFPGCPNVDAVRENLRRALAACSCDASVDEVDTSAPDTPAALSAWGSPTILVNGNDIAGECAAAGAACRLELPSEAAILAVLSRLLPA